MPSSLKNAVKRRTHKERAQPAARRKLGLLEKKKDYLLRARDFQKKQAAIQTLRRKAEERNPDEFYFAMESARTRQGVHIKPTAAPNAHSQAALALMRSQDAGYLTLKAQAEAKKVERLRSSLHMLGAPAPRQHVVFVDDEAQAAAFDPEQHFDTPAELLGRTYNRPRRAQLAAPDAVSAGAEAPAAAARFEKKRANRYRELLQRQERHATLASTVAEMQYKKEVAGKGRKRKLSPAEAGGQRGVFKWKAERKR